MKDVNEIQDGQQQTPSEEGQQFLGPENIAESKHEEILKDAAQQSEDLQQTVGDNTLLSAKGETQVVDEHEVVVEEIKEEITEAASEEHATEATDGIAATNCLKEGDSVFVNFGTPKNYLKGCTLKSILGDTEGGNTATIEVPTENGTTTISGIDLKFISKVGE
jgi:hypothetical protein